MVKITDTQAWIGSCSQCHGLVIVQWAPMPEDDFKCWNCGPEDIRNYPGAEVIVGSMLRPVNAL